MLLRIWYGLTKGPVKWVILVIGVILAALLIHDQNHKKAIAAQATGNAGPQRGMGNLGPKGPPKDQKSIPLSENETHPLPETQRNQTQQLLQTNYSQPPPQGAAESLINFYSEPTPTPAPVIEASLNRAAKHRAWMPKCSVLIPCGLIITVESSRSNTPVMGIVLMDMWAQNDDRQNLIIPAGTRIMCEASSAIRDRINVSGKWVLTWADGHQLEVNGVALSREVDIASQTFGMEDGTAGLQGEVQESDHWAAARAFLPMLAVAASQTLISAGTAFAGSLGQQNNNGGYNGGTNVQLAPLGGVFEQVVSQMLNGQTGDAKFVRVPGGTDFYFLSYDKIYPDDRFGPDKPEKPANINTQVTNEKNNTVNRVSY